MRRSFLIAFVGMLLLITSCTNSKSAKEETVDDSMVSNTLSDQVYKKHCVSCHQANGKGIRGMYPPLVNNKNISDMKYMIDVVTNGRSGQIEVDKKKYNGIMPSYNRLTNDELCELVNYIRTHFMHQTELLTIDEVVEMRNRKK